MLMTLLTQLYKIDQSALCDLHADANLVERLL